MTVSKAISMLTKIGHVVHCIDNEHCRVNGQVQYWPITGEWKNTRTGKTGMGISNLIKYLQTL